MNATYQGGSAHDFQTNYLAVTHLKFTLQCLLVYSKPKMPPIYHHQLHQCNHTQNLKYRSIVAYKQKLYDFLPNVYTQNKMVHSSYYPLQLNVSFGAVSTSVLLDSGTSHKLLLHPRLPNFVKLHKKNSGALMSS